MTIAKALTVGTFLASTLIAGTAFAKGHDNGFGLRAAGDLPHHFTRNLVTNEGGGGSETAYGTNGVQDKISDGSINNSVEARDREDPHHPSNKNDSQE